MMVEVILPAVSAPSPWVLGTASGMTSSFSAVFAVVDVVSPPSSIMAVEEDPVVVIVVTVVITVTFIWAQTLRPLPLLPPHTYSSISHFHIPVSSSPAMKDIPHSLSLYFP